MMDIRNSAVNSSAVDYIPAIHTSNMMVAVVVVDYKFRMSNSQAHSAEYMSTFRYWHRNTMRMSRREHDCEDRRHCNCSIHPIDHRSSMSQLHSFVLRLDHRRRNSPMSLDRLRDSHAILFDCHDRMSPSMCSKHPYKYFV